MNLYEKAINIEICIKNEDGLCNYYVIPMNEKTWIYYVNLWMKRHEKSRSNETYLDPYESMKIIGIITYIL